jgi:hypothetical protein
VTREETARLLQLIRAHYWQGLKDAENDRALQLETWAMTLAAQSTPDIESALGRWFATHEWPPQASQLIEEARKVARDRKAMIPLAEVVGDTRPVEDKYMSPEKYAEFRAWVAQMRGGSVGVKRMRREDA